MSVRRPHEHGENLVGEAQVVGETALPRDESQILDPAGPSMRCLGALIHEAALRTSLVQTFAHGSA